MMTATLSAKNQIVVPKEAREALGIKSGDKLTMVVRGNAVLILPQPAAYHAAILGLATDKSYPDNYLEKERESWD